MAKFYYFLLFSASTLCFCPFAYASEDTASPFPDNMIISDLPELPTNNEQPINNTAQTAQTDNQNVEDVVDIVPDSIKNENHEISNPTVSDIQIGTIPESSVEESENVTPIFLPPKNTNSSNDAKQPNGTKTTDKSLTETLKKENKQNIIEGTWIEKLVSANPLSTSENDNSKDDLVELVKKSRGKNKDGRSNASVFDISGIMLRMGLNQVEKTMKNRGFQRVNAKFTIPNFIKWRNEEACTSHGVIGFERLQSCITTLAKKGGYEYVYYVKYSKFDSKEEIEVFLTSNFTGNKVHKIIYKSGVPATSGNSPKAVYLRNIKVYDFWKKINQKYGNPDDKNNVTWGLGGNKPFLKAATGYLLLEDPMFVEMDYTRMSREDQRFIHSDYYNF